MDFKSLFGRDLKIRLVGVERLSRWAVSGRGRRATQAQTPRAAAPARLRSAPAAACASIRVPTVHLPDDFLHRVALFFPFFEDLPGFITVTFSAAPMISRARLRDLC